MTLIHDISRGRLCFRLTIRNVNKENENAFSVQEEGFRLTIRNINKDVVPAVNKFVSVLD